KQNGVHKLFLVQFVIDVRNKNYKKGDFSFENFTGQILYRELEKKAITIMIYDNGKKVKDKFKFHGEEKKLFGEEEYNLVYKPKDSKKLNGARVAICNEYNEINSPFGWRLSANSSTSRINCGDNEGGFEGGMLGTVYVYGKRSTKAPRTASLLSIPSSTTTRSNIGTGLNVPSTGFMLGYGAGGAESGEVQNSAQDVLQISNCMMAKDVASQLQNGSLSALYTNKLSKAINATGMANSMLDFSLTKADIIARSIGADLTVLKSATTVMIGTRAFPVIGAIGAGLGGLQVLMISVENKHGFSDLTTNDRLTIASGILGVAALFVSAPVSLTFGVVSIAISVYTTANEDSPANIYPEQTNGCH
nr:hypothetical protein [Pseudarcicella sp.]